ncbi:ribonuclease HI [Desulfohalobiaceae bacterium Ax17]|uniref:ribonuclease HI n=1 Tax=Desulfovulcanus ferrireducens TaxID=2831190 RepID=UPI00207BA6E6|nr:ribonuclease HI [Desulfovulcanus ferrireducens]MBT8764208.1 ribonuclease HI [Desulfovulcanus ferrireducens]
MDKQPYKVTIYTDGSSLGNPGPGGWAAILKYKDKRKELSQGFKLTTNNRMELLAIIKALEALKFPCQVDLYTDSKYVSNAITQNWIKKWQKNGWKTSGKKKVKNLDLWQKLLPLLNKHQVNFHWIKSHNGDEENEKCDLLAKQAAQSDNLLIDTNYVG